MKISIITVTLNSEKYIADCINSVKRQSYENIEHIIVDGKSTDRTIPILEKHRDCFAKLISETDRGMYDAINKGIDEATGDVIGILNSDDMFVNEHVVFNIVKCFAETDTDSVFGDLEFVDPTDTNRVCRFWKGNAYRRSRFKYGWMPAHPTFYLKRTLIEKYGKYENHFYTAADYEFMARYLYKHRVSSTYMNQLVVRMRAGGASNGSLKKWLRANRRDYLAMKKNDIPLPFLVSILKPLIKIRQFRTIFDSSSQRKKRIQEEHVLNSLNTQGKIVRTNAEFI